MFILTIKITYSYLEWVATKNKLNCIAQASIAKAFGREYVDQV